MFTEIVTTAHHAALLVSFITLAIPGLADSALVRILVEIASRAGFCSGFYRALF